MRRKLLWVAALFALLVFAVAAFKIYQTHTTRARVLALLTQAVEALQSTLDAQVNGRPVELARELGAAETRVSTLRSLDTSSVTALADAADDALITTREIMRRQVNIERSRAAVSLDIEQLARHLQTDRGAKDWTRDAVRIKGALDKDLREYRISVESYATLLDSLSTSQARLAPYLAHTRPVDEKLLKEARQQALDGFALADQNTKRVGTLNDYRVNATRAR
jgi:hypothetical protein